MEDYFDDVVQALCDLGWSLDDAENEAVERLSVSARKPAVTCGGIGVNYSVSRDGRIVFP